MAERRKTAARQSPTRKATAKKATAKKAAAQKTVARKASVSKAVPAKAKTAKAKSATAKIAKVKAVKAKTAKAAKAKTAKAAAPKAKASKAASARTAKAKVAKAKTAKAKSAKAKTVKIGAARPRRRDALNPGMPKGPVSFMHPEDVGKLHVPASKRQGKPIVPNYAQDEAGVDTVKVIMATDNFIVFESFRPKGAVDPLHQHPDHYSIVYQKAGRVRMRIGKDTVIVEAGDSYFHPIGVVHQHEALEDSIRIETKVYPKGGAVAAWRRLVGDPAS